MGLPTSLIARIKRFYSIIIVFFRKLKLSFYIGFYKMIMPGLIRSIKAKPVIRVLFVVNDLSCWKSETLYLRMMSHSRFLPILGLASSPENNTFRAKVEDYFIKKNYEYIDLDSVSLKQVSPDIIFYIKPYLETIPNSLRFTHYLRALYCYIPYGVQTISQSWTQDLPLLSIVWQQYFLNQLTADDRGRFMYDNKQQIRVTGLPFLDSLLKDKGEYPDPWEEIDKDHKKIRVIYSPHHTVGDRHLPGIAFSTFLENGEFLLDLSKKYRGQIVFAFKPHPNLNKNLARYWDQKRIDNYYSAWKSGENTFLCEGDYVGLFLHSDAIIHDCSSFVVEYLYTRNPCLYLLKKGSIDQDLSFNSFASAALSNHYVSRDQAGIVSFLDNLILGVDAKKDSRDSFFNNYLLPPNGRSASDNIIDCILGE